MRESTLIRVGSVLQTVDALHITDMRTMKSSMHQPNADGFIVAPCHMWNVEGRHYHPYILKGLMQCKGVDERIAKYHYDVAKSRALFYFCHTPRDVVMVNTFLDPIMHYDATLFVESVWNDAAWNSDPCTHS